ncbi:unnamed protein product [Eruca vesicaria subsp. sativa]|uniref:CCHC-type domain-containing protein n=1 Tax=Eruca vesicaria subsp. sativa TaxID=29727 RepID=A0ABC8M275_ERUVS|nr:unnamed protein product [Eruca vesicaria subsp. sativa]
MPKHKNFKFDDGEDLVASRDGGSDEEANEDLSLKTLGKTLSRHDSKETSMSGSVLLNGRNVMITNLEEDAHQISEENMVETGVPKEQENDKVEKSSEPKHEGTSSNMVLKKLLRGARYFDPPDAGWEACYSCGEQGHATVNCPTPTTRKKPCFICGSLEHGAKQCVRDTIVIFAKKVATERKIVRCGCSGHDMILCKYEYSREDLKRYGLCLATDVVNWVTLDWYVVDTMRKAHKKILPAHASNAEKKGISHANARTHRA